VIYREADIRSPSQQHDQHRRDHSELHRRDAPAIPRDRGLEEGRMRWNIGLLH
jgi:hypothetical protein